MTNFDEIPVGKTANPNAFNEPEIPETEEDEEKKPLEFRVKSRNFKIRKNSFEFIFNEIKKSTSPNDPVFETYTDYYFTMLNDSHFLGQEVGLDVAIYLFSNFENAFTLVPELVKVIIEKCLSSTKQNIKLKSQQAIIGGLEISNDLKDICDILKKLLDSKNPKIQTSAVQACILIISSFGSFKIDYRSLIPSVEKLTESNNVAVRNDALEFYKELYKWIRDSIKPLMSKLKEAYQKDLEKAFDEIFKSQPKIPTPTNFLKPDKLKNSQNKDLKQDNDYQIKIQMMKEQEKNYSLAEGTDVFKNFPDTWTEEILKKEKKWIEKKEMLEKFTKDSKVFKLKNTEHSHITAAFIRLLKDSNVNVVSSTIIAIETLSEGLRKDMSESKEYFPILLEKLRDKDRRIITNSMNCLENIIQQGSVNYIDALDEIRNSLNNEKSTSQAKEKLCNLIEKTILKTYLSVLKKNGKKIAEILFKVTDDCCAEVRDAALHALGILKFRVGDMIISHVLNEISDIKKKKIEEATNEDIIIDPIYENEDKPLNNKKNIVQMEIDHEVVKKPVLKSCTSNNLLKINDTSKDVTMSNGNEETIQRPNSQVNTKNNNMNNKQKKPANQNAQGKSQPPPQNNKNNDIEEEDSNNISNEEIEEIIRQKLGSEFMENINHSKWDLRRDAFTNLSEWVTANSDTANLILDIILKFIKIKLKDYKENNFNIVKEALGVVDTLVLQCNNFSKKHASQVMRKICDKIGDMKMKDRIVSLLFKFMDYLTPKYVLSFMLKLLNASKPQNTLKEFSLVLEKSIEDYGIGILPVKEIVEYAKILANHTSPQLRTTATSLFCTIYKHIGPNINKFITDIKEATLNLIQEAFKNVQIVSSTGPKRELKGEALLELKQSNDNANNLDSLFPRADITKLITPKIIKSLKEGKWEAKKESIEALEKILSDSNMRIQPNGLNELMVALKLNLSDKNKNLVRILVQYITKLFEALGIASKQFLKSLLSLILFNLADKSQLLRDDIVKCIEKLGEVIGYENVISYFPSFFNTENFELRNELLKYLLKFRTSISKMANKEELIPSIILCLQDKSNAIRNGAEELTKELSKYIIPYKFMEKLSDLKPAIANSLKPILEKNTKDYSVVDLKRQEIISDNIKTFTNPQDVMKTVKPNPNKRDVSGSAEKDSKKKIGNLKNQPSQNNIKKINFNDDKIQANLISEVTKLEQLKEEHNSKMLIDSPIPNTIIIQNKIKHRQKEKRLEIEKSFQIVDFFSESYIIQTKNNLSNFIQQKYCELAFVNDVNKNNSFITAIQTAMKNETISFIEILDIILKWIFIKTVENKNTFFWDKFITDFLLEMAKFLIDIDYFFQDIESKLLLNMTISKIFSLNPSIKKNTYDILNEISKIMSFDILFDFFIEKMSKIEDKIQQKEIFDLFKNLVKLNERRILNSSIYMKKSLELLENLEEKAKKYVLEIISIIINKDEKTCLLIKELSNPLQIFIMNNIQREDLKIFAKFENQKTEMMNIDEPPKAKLQDFEHNNVQKEGTMQAPGIVNKENKFISKSPIISNQKKRIIETPSHVNPEVVQGQLTQMIEKISNKNLAIIEKNLVFVDMLNFVKDKFDENFCILLKKTNELIVILIDNLVIILENLIQEEYFNSLKYLLPIILTLVQQKEFCQRISNDNLLKLYEILFKSMINENMPKTGENEKSTKVFIKSLNEIIFSLMENCNSTNTYINLIKIIEKSRNINPQLDKVACLSIKCLIKLNNILNQIIDELEVDQIIRSIFLFLISFETTNPLLESKSNSDEMCLRIMKSTINEIVKIKKEKIWIDYKKCFNQNEQINEKNIKKWIQLFMRSIKGQSVPTNLTPGKSNIEEVSVLIEKIENEKDAKIKEKYFLEIISILRKRNLTIDYLQSKLNKNDFTSIKSLWPIEKIEETSKNEKQSELNQNPKLVLLELQKGLANIQNTIGSLPKSNISFGQTSLPSTSLKPPCNDDPSVRLNHYRSILHNFNRENKSVQKNEFLFKQGESPVKNEFELKGSSSIMDKFQKLREKIKNDVHESRNISPIKTIVENAATPKNDINRLNELRTKLEQMKNFKK